MMQRLATEMGVHMLSNKEADFLLWEWTAFPFAQPHVIVGQLRIAMEDTE